VRSYRQRCALAKTLDVVGDRWTLLIVRELLIRGACRYSDLRAGLPGVATNLLAQRLRAMEKAGIITREEAPPPVATTLLRLTPRGQELERVVLELGRWGAPLLKTGSSRDKLLAHWLVLPLKLHLTDRRPNDRACSIEIRADGETITVNADQGSVNARLGRCENPDATVSGDAHAILQFFAGRLDTAAAKSAGVRFEGSAAAIARVIRKERASAQF
jgi:DNA-binding HxlR family transcriptional regulator